MKKQKYSLFLFNKKGQMAVFIVLIFQVLFVLFAMVINIGLIVHDKINLQNSVDLAAYYVAQRQAESLNIIAHQNYQIRQAWKLLAWRYFVLGTSASSTGAGLRHPAVPGVNLSNNTNDKGCYTGFQAYTPPGSQPPLGVCKKSPVICMYGQYPWAIPAGGGTIVQDNYCRGLSLSIGTLSATPSIISWLGAVAGTISGVALSNSTILKSCTSARYMQMLFATSILTAFDHEQSDRLRILYDIARILSKNADIDGKSLHNGAFNVFKKNLSYANTKEINSKDFKTFNSISGIKISDWLVPVVVNPGLILTKFQTSPSSSVGCVSNANKAVILTYDELINSADYGEQAFVKTYGPSTGKTLYSYSQASVRKLGPYNLANVLSFVDADKPTYENPKFLSMGVEKNPWYRVYAGVSATTSPRELFWVGKKIVLAATAFATPFGGRVGPWYGKSWPSGKPKSEGVTYSDRIDRLLPPRDQYFPSDGSLNQENWQEFIPNFARFPGDKLGLFSTEALSAVKLEQKGDSKLSMDNLVQSAFNFKDSTKDGGVQLGAQSTLSLVTNNDQTSPRAMELAAISPNFFDITYYSVFPDARNSFMGRLAKLSDTIVIRDDVGNYTENAPNGKVTTVIKRIEALITKTKVFPKKGYFITKPQDLLTAWVPNGPYKYGFNTKAFQKCSSGWADNSAPVMGACPSGGRVGYSVKIISKNLLTSGTDLALGGEGTSGSVRNPPPSTELWP